jgi:hypothetical protein
VVLTVTDTGYKRLEATITGTGTTVASTNDGRTPREHGTSCLRLRMHACMQDTEVIVGGLFRTK